MFSFDFSAPQVQASIISGGCSIISTIIAAITAKLIGQVISNRRKLQEYLDLAIKDIAFLLEVEKLHCERNKEKLEGSQKNKIRLYVRRSGYSFSGKFTPGRVKETKINTNNSLAKK
ncbi:hypothetical protein [Geminocystis sp. NIES-3709]|uniref:hypothetical protein n=1 Tax=Geminocystis sp. NIES-3709 TaxID=1617448 RepID=UPI0005FCBC6E|nr:hypothetical protein [Geminocystis sp. NIES-3709]BAQ64467.1 hypothetical protein GM3709_1232 [Geminocystis sp. NIES-3709]